MSETSIEQTRTLGSLCAVSRDRVGQRLQMSNHAFELNRHAGSIHPANGSGAAVNDEVDAMDVRSGRPGHIADGDGAARLQIAEPSRTRQEKNRITYLLISRSESRLAAAPASWRWRRG